MPTLVQLAPGTLFANDFRVVRPLADGGMGSVYVVEQLSTGRERALKLMHPQFVADPANRRRFAEEARAGSRIESDHVVEVIASGVDEASGNPWLAMELLHGETLHGRVEKYGPVPPAEAYEILRQVCHALGAAHRAGLVHRDVKPDNIFLASTRREGIAVMVKVLDFGIAKVVQDARGTATGSMGTPLWMAPEQSDPRGQIGPPTDVWAIGLIAFYLLTGRSFWTAGSIAGSSIHAMMREALFDAIPAASARATEFGLGSLVPTGFDEWFARAVQRDAAARFPDASAAAQSLEFALIGSRPPRTEPIPARAPGVLPSVSVPAFQPATAAAPTVWPATLDAAALSGAPPTNFGVAPTAVSPARPRSRTPSIVGAALALCAVGGLAAVLASRGASTTAPTIPVTAIAPAVPVPATPLPVAPAIVPVAPQRVGPASPSGSAQPRRAAAVRPTPAPRTTPTVTPVVPTDVPTAAAPPNPLAPLQNLPFNQWLQQGSQVGRERVARELERYLERNPNAPDSDTIRQRITALRAPPTTP